MDAERRIADLEAQIAAKDSRIAAQAAHIAEQAAHIAEQDERIAAQDKRIAELEKKIAAPFDELGRNSSNSNLPPSSDSPTARSEKNARKRAGKSATRKRGAHPGHRGTRRELLPAVQVDVVEDLFPSHCEHCAAVLRDTHDPQPVRFSSPSCRRSSRTPPSTVATA